MTHEKGIEGRERGRGQSGDRIEALKDGSLYENNEPYLNEENKIS